MNSPQRRVLVAIVGLVLALWLFRQVREFLRQDACLDRGGIWNRPTQECTGAPQY